MVTVFVHDPSFMRERRARGGKAIDYLGIFTAGARSPACLQIVLDRGQRAD